MALAALLNFDRRPSTLLAPTAWALPKVHLGLLQASFPSRTHEVTMHNLPLRSFL